MKNENKKQIENINNSDIKSLSSDVRLLVCMNLKRTCSALDVGKCKMINAKCVFQQTCA